MPTDAPKTVLVADADGRGDRIKGDQPSDEAIRTLFGRQARRGYYDLLPTLGGLGSRSPIRRRMVAKLGLRAGDRVLDIACGAGLGFAALESVLGPGGEIVGVDFTPEMLARASRRIARRRWSNVRLVEADARTLPFEEGVFSAVCSTLAFGGSDWERLLHEALRVLSPGGRIAMIDATPLQGPWKLAESVLVAFERRVAAWEPPQPPIEQVVGELVDDANIEAALYGLWAIISGTKPSE